MGSRIYEPMNINVKELTVFHPFFQVMKTPLDDLEIQNVIDLLLTRQTGSSSSNYHDWVDASDKKNETKILQGQLAEKEALLAEETAKVKSITDKMAALR